MYSSFELTTNAMYTHLVNCTFLFKYKIDLTLLLVVKVFANGVCLSMTYVFASR